MGEMYVRGLKKKKQQILKTEDGEKNCIQGTTRYAAWGDSVICQIPAHLQHSPMSWCRENVAPY